MGKFGLVRYCRYTRLFVRCRRSPGRRVYSAAARRALRIKLVLRFEWLATTVITFGKYKDTPWLLIPDNYIAWATAQYSMQDRGMFAAVQELRSALKQAFPQHATWVWDACPNAIAAAATLYCASVPQCIVQKCPVAERDPNYA